MFLRKKAKALVQRNQNNPWGNDDIPSLDKQLESLRKSLSQMLGGFGSGGGSGSGGTDLPPRFYLLVIVAAALLWGVGGFYTVDAREQAVILRLGTFHDIKQPGLNWRALFIDSKYQVEVTRIRTYENERSMITQDLNIITVPMSIQYVVGDIRAYVLKVQDPEIIIERATESALRHVVGTTTMDQVLTTGRDRVAIEVQDRLQSYLNEYESGLEVRKVNILRGKPPEAVEPSFVDVVKSYEDRTAMENQAKAYANRIEPEARGEAQRMIEEATAYKASLIARAEGETQRFNALYEQYQLSPEVLRTRLYLETMEAVLSKTQKAIVDIDGSGNVLYLPLPGVGQGAGQTNQSMQSENQNSRLLEELKNEIGRLRSEAESQIPRRTRRSTR